MISRAIRRRNEPSPVILLVQRLQAQAQAQQRQ